MTQHDEFKSLPEEEAAELESLLRSFRPREPNLELPEAADAGTDVLTVSRSTNAWTLAATWVSGALVGALAVSIINQDTTPHVRPARNHDAAQTVQVDRNENHSDLLVEPILPQRELGVGNAFADAATVPEWTLPTGSLAVGTHLGTQLASQHPSAKSTETKPVSEELGLYPQDPHEINRPRRQPTTRHDLLREFRESPGSLL